VMHDMPRGMLKMLCAADLISGPQIDIAIVGPRDHAATQALLNVLHSRFLPSKMVAMHDASSSDAAATVNLMPMLESKEMVSGRPAAYVCRDSVCDAPVTTPDELLRLLGAEHLIGVTE